MRHNFYIKNELHPLNTSIKDQIQNHSLFSGDAAGLSLITNQPHWSGDVFNIVKNNNLLPGASDAQINLIITDGVAEGDQIFWDTYNYPLLVEAFERGDNIRLVSNPVEYRGDGSGYGNEIQAIESGINGYEPLITQYGYVYNDTTKMYEKQ